MTHVAMKDSTQADAHGADHRLVHFHVVAGQFAKSSEHDATLKTNAILLRIHNAQIQTRLNFV